MPLPIDIYCEYPSPWLVPVDRVALEKVLAVMILQANKSIGYRAIHGLELHLVDDAIMAERNAQFMSCCGPTNILSFPGGEDMPGVLILSLDMFTRESILYGQPKIIHFLRLLSHGIGHIAGLDHGGKMDALMAKCCDAAIVSLRNAASDMNRKRSSLTLDGEGRAAQLTGQRPVETKPLVRARLNQCT